MRAADVIFKRSGAWFLLLFFAQLCAASERELSTQVAAIAEKIAKTGKKSVAVADFADLQGNVTELGRFLAEEISVGLADVGNGFEVIDRGHLEDLLAEHRLSVKGLIDPATTRQLKVAGVQALVTGSVIPLGDSIRLTVKVLDVETAHIIASKEVDVPKTQAIQELLERGMGSGPGEPARPRAPVSKGQRQEAEGVVFELRSCTLSGERVQCALRLTSNASDLEVVIRNARAVDESGGEHLPSSMFGPSKKCAGGFYGCLPQLQLVAGVPMNATFEFTVPAGTRKLPLLEISGTTSHRREFNVKFLGVGLSH